MNSNTAVQAVQNERPPVSLSMAGNCRMKLWLAGHDYPQLPTRPQSQRTFDMGHAIEAMMFDGIPEGNGRPEIEAWWPSIGEIKDNASGRMIHSGDWDVSDRQLEVEWEGYKGHIDGLLTHTKAQDECRCEPRWNLGDRILPDCKSTSGIGYKKSLTGDLANDQFAKGYVFQLAAYREGFRAAGVEVDGTLLIYMSKEQSKVMARFLPFDADVVEEAKERLSWAKSPVEPTPDYFWKKGDYVPLVCGYCSYIESCSEVRGQPVELEFQDFQPKWRVK